MRVLFWSAVFWPNIGGVEVHAARFLPSLRTRGCEFLVITTQTDADQAVEADYDGIPIYRMPFGDGASYSEVDKLARIRHEVAALKRSFAAHLIHINAVDKSNFFHLLTSHVAPAPLLVTLHGEWPTRGSALVKQTLSAADWVAGCSHAILEKGRELAPDIRSRSSVIHNGVEVSGIQPSPLPFESPRLLCLGRLSDEKGFDIAVAALPAVLKQFPETRLVIAGGGSCRLKLERQTAELGIGHHVDFLGWVEPEEVLPLINTSTIVLIPSRSESFGLVALEAAVMARPVTAARTGGLPEVVVHGRTGLLVETENAQDLSDSVISLLRRPEMAINLGQAARIRAEASFSWKSHVDGYEALYRRLSR